MFILFTLSLGPFSQPESFLVTWNLELGYSLAGYSQMMPYIVQRGTGFSAWAFGYLSRLVTEESIKLPSHTNKAKQTQSTPVRSCLSIFKHLLFLPYYVTTPGTSCSFHGMLGCHHLQLWMPLCLDRQAPRNTPSATLSLGPTEVGPLPVMQT